MKVNRWYSFAPATRSLECKHISVYHAELENILPEFLSCFYSWLVLLSQMICNVMSLMMGIIHILQCLIIHPFHRLVIVLFLIFRNRNESNISLILVNKVYFLLLSSSFHRIILPFLHVQRKSLQYKENICLWQIHQLVNEKAVTSCT